MRLRSHDLGRLIDRVSDAVCSIVLFGMVTVTAVDVVGRYVFNRPLPGGFEISELLLALAIFAGLPAVTRDGTHITVDLLTSRLGPRARRVQQIASDTVASVMSATLAVFMFRKMLDVAVQHDATAYLNLPVAPIAGFMALSCALAAGLFAVRVVRDPDTQPAGRSSPGEQTWQ